MVNGSFPAVAATSAGSSSSAAAGDTATATGSLVARDGVAEQAVVDIETDEESEEDEEEVAKKMQVRFLGPLVWVLCPARGDDIDGAGCAGEGGQVSFFLSGEA